MAKRHSTLRIHYIIFHPESKRQIQNVFATSLVTNQIITNWKGDIYVDKIGIGNEDPFVFNDPWLYSYCHASHLRQKQNNNKGYIQNGSWLLFTSGKFADNGFLTFDTCFLVDKIHSWEHSPLRLPTQFQYLQINQNNRLWRRHFRFPFLGQHSRVKHTFEAKLWDNTSSNYSFLPYKTCGERISFPISRLSLNLAYKINEKIPGKYPVDLIDSEIVEILKTINGLTQIKVLKNIH